MRKSGSLSLDEPDLSSILSECDSALHFIEAVIGQSDLPRQVLSELNGRLRQIQRRRDDPNLYVAVVGEFNSGKSTFINALLHQNLLQSSHLVRTAAPTKIIYAPQLDFTVLFLGQQKPLGYLKEREQLKQQLRAISPVAKMPGELRPLLHLITTDEKIAPHVQEVTIYHPSPFLGQHIVIIDTPGINKIEQHSEITQHVIGQQADLAIVLIPAYAPLSNVLTTFLEGPLKPFLHRCIPVVTCIDQIPTQYQQQLLDGIQQDLRTIRGAEQSVTLYSAAAKVVLDTMDPNEKVPEHLQVWNSRFIELEQATWDRLCYQRTFSITESLLRLLNELFKDLETHLRNSQKHYKVREAAINREVIPDLTSFADQERHRYSKRLTDAISDAKEKQEDLVRSYHNRAWGRISDKLYEAESDSDFGALGEVANDIVTEEQNDFVYEFRDVITTMEQDIEEVVDVVRQHFDDAYRRLTAVGQLDLSSEASVDYRDMMIDIEGMFGGVSSAISEVDSSEALKVWGGVGAGAAIGTMIFPGVGTVLGGILGGVFGSWFISPDKKRRAVRERLEPAVDGFFETLGEQASNALDAYEKEARKGFKRQVQAYVSRYSAVVAKIQQEQTEESERLQRLQQAVQTDLKNIERWQKVFGQMQQQLAKIL
jgi:GTPase Era involved in 16S rRNA processing